MKYKKSFFFYFVEKNGKSSKSSSNSSSRSSKSIRSRRAAGAEDDKIKNPALKGAVGGAVAGLAASSVANTQSDKPKSNAGLLAIMFVLLLVAGLGITLFLSSNSK